MPQRTAAAARGLHPRYQQRHSALIASLKARFSGLSECSEYLSVVHCIGRSGPAHACLENIVRRIFRTMRICLTMPDDMLKSSQTITTVGTCLVCLGHYLVCLWADEPTRQASKCVSMHRKLFHCVNSGILVRSVTALDSITTV